MWIRVRLDQFYAPSEDQRPFRRRTSAGYSHLFVVIYQDERKEWLSGKLSLQLQRLSLLLMESDANHYQVQGSVNE